MTTPLLDPTLLLPAFLAAAAYTLTPGPAFLALLGIGAVQGRRAGVGFLVGHLAGDVTWASLALVAIIGAQSLGTAVFDLLGLACGVAIGAVLTYVVNPQAFHWRMPLTVPWLRLLLGAALTLAAALLASRHAARQATRLPLARILASGQ